MSGLRRLAPLVVLLALACTRPPSPPVAQTNDEFRKVWTLLEQSDNWCFGHGRPNQTKADLKKPDLTPQERCTLLRRLSVQHLRLSENEQALKAVEDAMALAQAEGLKENLPEIHGERGLVWLRLAEVRNCVLSSNQSSCIFPLDENAVHLDKEPAEKAFDDLLAYLKLRQQSDDSFYHSRRWLLNIAAMQLGRYPKSVPKEFRLDLGDFQQPSEPFRDVAGGVGITAKNLAGGAAVEDMDGDGLLDILTASCDYREPTRYYRNRGDGTFEDLTEAAGLKDQTGAFNVRLADYDNDGKIDILLLRGAFLRRLGEVRNSLLHNNGDGTFSDVTEAAGLAYPAHPTGTAAWGDFDNDGDLDLFVGNETVPKVGQPLVRNPCQLFRNNGDGTFTDVAETAGVEGLIYCKGVAAGDIDNDGDLDLFASNFAHHNLPPELRGTNLLFRNKGDGTFEEVGASLGIDGPSDRAFATWFFDYDNDGWLDLFVVCYETDIEDEVSSLLGLPPKIGRTRLFRNQQGQGFVNVSDKTNLDAVMSTMGCSFGDMDNDGFLDLYLGTGTAYYYHLVPNLMLRNVDGKSFEDVTFARGLGHLQKGHGIVFADFDNDGDQDLYAQMGGNFPGDTFSNSLFQNPGNDNHFLHLKLVSSNQVVGARVEVDLGTRKVHRAVGLVSSFGHTPLRQEIGLGQETVKQIVVQWPSGQEQVFENPPIDCYLELEEGRNELKELPLKAFPLREPQPGDPFCAPTS